MLNIIISLSEFFVGLGIIVYWIFFYTVVKKDSKKSIPYITHERSFPIADLGWVMPNLFIASLGVILSQKFGIFFSISSGSSLIFLALLDITFNVQNKVFSNNISDTIIHLFINLSCMVFGTVFLIFGWLNF